MSQINPETMKRNKEAIQGRMPYPRKIYLNHTLAASQTAETTAAQMTTTQTTTMAAAQAETLAADETETFSAQYAWMESVSGKNPFKRTEEIVPCSPEILLTHPNLKPHREAFADSQLHILVAATRPSCCTIFPHMIPYKYDVF